MMIKKKGEVLGEWWFATNTDQRWLGTLYLEIDRTSKLEITIPLPDFKLPSTSFPFVMNGMNQYGVPISLLFCGPPQSRNTFAFTIFEFSAGYSLIGIHVTSVDAFHVDSLTLGIQHLDRWAGFSGFNNPNTPDLDFQIGYKQPVTQVFQMTSEMTVELFSSFDYQQSWKGYLIGEDFSIRFRTKGKLSLQDCNTLITAFRHLLHFAVLQQVYPTFVTGNKEGLGNQLGDQFIPQDISIYSSLLREEIESEIDSSRWIFRFSDVQNDFGAFFERWFLFLTKFEEAFAGYMSIVYHGMPGNLTLLCLTQALEAYHSIKFTSHKTQKFEKKIFEMTQPHIASLKGLVDDCELFCKTVLHNRNYYTHYNPVWQRDGLVVSGGELTRLNEKLKIIFQMNVLADNGIPVERFTRLRQQLASHIIDYV